MLTATVHVFPDSVFCIGSGALGSNTASNIWERKAEDVVKSGTCVSVRRLCKYCKSSKHSCRKPGTNLRVVQTVLLPRAFSTRSLTGKAPKGTSNTSSSSERISYLRSTIQTWLWVFLWSIRKDMDMQRSTTISPICRRVMGQSRASDDT